MGGVGRAQLSVAASVGSKVWESEMAESDFEFMREILSAPSPVGLEAAMTEGVLAPAFEEFAPEGWEVKRYAGSASLVVDSDPGNPSNKPTVMVCGHADKIRMQVRSIDASGKVYIQSDSYLPSTLLGNEVVLYSEDPESPGAYRALKGATVEALGAIHFAPPAMRSGDAGVKPESLFLEFHVHGENGKDAVESLGIRPGDPILLDRPIQKGVWPNTFTGAYLDNGLGCFVTAQLAKGLAQNPDPLDDVRVLFAFAAYEEIGRFGSRVLVGEENPDVLIAVDVNHDYAAAPNVGDKRYQPLTMGKGATLASGSIASEALNSLIMTAAKNAPHGPIPVQRDVNGVDTGTDAMAGVLAAQDVAATSIGFPTRSMHTVSESASTHDVLAAVALIDASIRHMSDSGFTVDTLKSSHPRLDLATPLVVPTDIHLKKKKKDEAKDKTQ